MRAVLVLVALVGGLALFGAMDRSDGQMRAWVLLPKATAAELPAEAGSADVEEVRGLAEQGNAEGQTKLGAMYLSGSGIPQNDAEAVKWFRKAAEQGEARAQVVLGLMYAEGSRVPKNNAEAVKWLRLAADQGLAVAQSTLGSKYFFGEGVPQDDAEAAKWNRLAAEQGDAEGQAGLGVMYALGRGVPQRDYAEAYFWLNLAASQEGNRNEEDKIKDARDMVAAHLTPEARSAVQARTRTWTPKKSSD